jgi:hypothetical protein
LNIKYIDVPPENTTGIAIFGLAPDTEYTFQVTAKFIEGDTLSSDPVTARTPAGGKIFDF